MREENYMTILSKEEILKTKEYLESQPQRMWFGNKGLTPTEADLFDTIEALYKEKEELAKYNEIYKRFITTLSNLLLQHIEEDGYCRMIVKEDEVNKFLEVMK